MLQHSVLACLQGTFPMKGARSPFQELLSRSYLSMALTPSGHGKQPLQLQVFLTDTALLDCASGELLLAPPCPTCPGAWAGVPQ